MGWERNATVQGVTGGIRNIICCSRKGEVHGNEGGGLIPLEITVVFKK